MRKFIVVIYLGIFSLSFSSSPICNINQELNKDTTAKSRDLEKLDSLKLDDRKI